MTLSMDDLIKELKYINTNKSRVFLNRIHDVTQKMRAEAYVNYFFNNPKYIRDRKGHVEYQIQRLMFSKVPAETIEKYRQLADELLAIDDVIQVTLGPDRKFKRDVDFELLEFKRKRFAEPERIRAELQNRIAGLRARPYPIIKENVGLPSVRWLGVNPINLVLLVEMNRKMVVDVLIVEDPEFVQKFEELVSGINIECSKEGVLNIEKAATLVPMMWDNCAKLGNDEPAPLGHGLEHHIAQILIQAEGVAMNYIDSAALNQVDEIKFDFTGHLRAVKLMREWVMNCFSGSYRHTLYDVGFKPYWFWFIANDLLVQVKQELNQS